MAGTSHEMCQRRWKLQSGANKAVTRFSVQQMKYQKLKIGKSCSHKRDTRRVWTAESTNRSGICAIRQRSHSIRVHSRWRFHLWRARLFR